MITFYYKRRTNTELSHTVVRFDEVYLGYYIKNKSQSAKVNENWNFVSKSPIVTSCFAKTRSQLIVQIKDQLK